MLENTQVARGETAARKAIISKVKGQVEVRIAETEWKPAKVGMTLHENDSIRTLAKSSCDTLVDDEGKTGKLEIKENSLIRFNTLTWDSATGDKKTMVDVAVGAVKVNAKKLQGNSQFEVNTPTAVLGIRGTKFDVKVWEEKKNQSTAKK